MFEIKVKATVIGFGIIDGTSQAEFKSADKPEYYFQIPMAESEVVKFKLYETLTLTITGIGWNEN